MKTSTVAIPAAGITTAIAGTLARRRTIARWADNPDPLDGRPVRFPDAERRSVQLADGAEIATWFVGSGPTIVLVHGLTASRHDWGPIAPALVESGYRVVAVEQRGHGESTAGTAGYGSTQLGMDLGDVFSALDLHATCLVGHSMGGMASMGFAATRPGLFSERVDSFVSIASAGAINVARQSLGLRLGGITLPEQLTDVPATRLRLIAGLGAFGRNPSLHMIDEAIASFQKIPEEVRGPATAALASHDLLEDLRGLEVTSLVLGGGRDQLIRPTQVHELHETLPNSELYMYPDAGHLLIWERHDDIARRIDRFAQSVLSTVSG